MTVAADSWPRRRLQVRSALSAALPIGWIWVGLTALVPYFLIGRGPGSGSLEMLGVARTTWLDMHVWSSISMGLITLGHALLNRRGLARSYRIVGGLGRSEKKTRTPRAHKLAWIPALALLAVTLGGSWAFAAASSERAGANGAAHERPGAESSDTAQIEGVGFQHRGGR